MKSKVVRIDKDIANEIKRMSGELGITTTKASQVLFLKCNKRGRPRKNMLDKTFAEAKIDYKRRKLKEKVVYNL